MKHIKLFEQFVNENESSQYEYPGTTVGNAVNNGRSVGRYKDPSYLSWNKDYLTTVTNKNEYSVELFEEAIRELKSAGITAKDTANDKKLVIEFTRNSKHVFEYKDGKWGSHDGSGSDLLPMNLYQFIFRLCVKRYHLYKDKPVGKP